MKITSEDCKIHSKNIIQKLYGRPVAKDIDGFYDFESDEVQMINIVNDYLCHALIPAHPCNIDNADPDQNITRYAWVNLKLKTWFFTKSKKEILPIGSKLLFLANGTKTSEPVSAHDTYPRQGSVILDTNLCRIKVNNIDLV